MHLISTLEDLVEDLKEEEEAVETLGEEAEGEVDNPIVEHTFSAIIV